LPAVFRTSSIVLPWLKPLSVQVAGLLNYCPRLKIKKDATVIRPVLGYWHTRQQRRKKARPLWDACFLLVPVVKKTPVFRTEQSKKMRNSLFFQVISKIVPFRAYRKGFSSG